MKFSQIKLTNGLITEGVKFGQNEKQLVQSNGNQFNIGIEYEFHVPGGAKTALGDVDIKDVEATDVTTVSIRDIEEYINTDIGSASPLDRVGDDLFMSKVFYGEEQGICLISKPQDHDNHPYTGIIFNNNESAEVYAYPNAESKPNLITSLSQYVDHFDDPDYTIIKHFFNALSQFQSQFQNSEGEYSEDVEFSKDQSIQIVTQFMDTLLEYTEKDNINIASDITLEYENIFFDETSPYKLDFMSDFFNIMDDYIRPYALSKINYGDTRPERFNKDVEEISQDFLNDLYNFSSNFNTNIDNVPFVEHVLDIVKEYFEELYSKNIINHLIISIDYSDNIDKDYFNKLESSDELIQAIVPEDQGDQIEIITKQMNLENALEHIKKTFSMLKSKESFYTTNESGLHISISVKNDPQNVNLVKFLILHKMGYVIDIFPERENVDSIMVDILDQIGSSRKLPDFVNYILKNNSEKILKDIDNNLSKGVHFNNKSVSINFKEFTYMDGRIELRYFGGRNYENRYEDIEHLLLRSLYFLTVSTTNAYHKQYMKALYEVLDQSFQKRVGMGISDIIYATKYFSNTDKEKIDALDTMVKKLNLNNDRYLEIIYDTIYGRK